MVPETPSEDPQVYNYGHRILFAFFFPLLLSRSFQGLHHIWDHNRLKAGSDMSIHLSSVKSEIKEIFKNVKQCHPC